MFYPSLGSLRAWRGLFMVLSLSFLSACATNYQPQKRAIHQQGVSLGQAINLTSQHLYTQIAAHHEHKKGRLGFLNRQLGKVVVDEFIDRDSQESVMATQQITQALIQAARGYAAVQAYPLSRQYLPNAHYVIRGYVYYDPQKNSQYRLFASAQHLASGEMITLSQVFINDRGMNFARTPEYRDTPTFPIRKGKTGDELARLDPETRAILNDAGKAYARKDFKTAQQLYTQASERPQGQVARTYSGLYISELRLGQHEAAEAAFERLIKINLSKRQNIALKLLFQVNSTEFVGDQFATAQYQMWLKKIAELIAERRRCLKIVGHSSRTGQADYNIQLSHQRAIRVQNDLANTFPEVNNYSKTLGKGFSENIVGSGTDDQRDVVDRRVEFLQGC
ncbi:MAG: OmpA family protein [bacterium]